MANRTYKYFNESNIPGGMVNIENMIRRIQALEDQSRQDRLYAIQLQQEITSLRQQLVECHQNLARFSDAEVDVAMEDISSSSDSDTSSDTSSDTE